MKLIGSAQATAALLLPPDDTKPQKGFVPQLVAQAMARKLNITGTIRAAGRQNVPMPTRAGIQLVQVETPLALPSGFLEGDGKPIAVARVEIPPDFSMITVVCSNTTECDQVLDAFIPILEQEFEFRNLRATKRIYASNLVVEFDKSLEGYVQALKALSEVIAPPMREAAGIKSDPSIERLSFGFDPADILPTATQQIAFIIERRQGHPFSQNRYFCAAPFQTDAHIQLLERVEQTLKSFPN